jgi:hypothetical protein
MPEVFDLAFQSITVFEVPPQIEKVVHKQKREEGAAVYVVEDKVYIVASRGEMPTGGYSIRVVGIEEEEDGRGVNVSVEYKDPKPGQMVAQVVTYPYAIVKTDLKGIPDDVPFRILVDGTQRAVHTAQEL